MARWAVICGEDSDPKAQCALEVADRLASAGVRVGGVVQRRHGSGESKSYELQRVGSPDRLPLAKEGVAPRDASEEAFCTYAFRLDAFAQARRWVEEDASRCPVLVLGDVSKMEVAGRGHAASLAFALSLGDEHLVLLTARTSQLGYLVGNFGLVQDPVASLELPASPEERDRFADELVRALGPLALADPG